MTTQNKIQLRALEPTDVDLMYQWENDKSVWPVSGTLVPFSKHTMEQFVKMANQDIYTNKQLRLAIDIADLKDNKQETIGYVDLFDFDPTNRKAGVGILIGKEESRRKGFALQALNLLTDYAFNVLLLHQLHCNIHVNNEASIKLFSAAGYIHSGELQDWTFTNGSYVNVFIMQKLNPVL